MGRSAPGGKNSVGCKIISLVCLVSKALIWILYGKGCYALLFQKRMPVKGMTCTGLLVAIGILLPQLFHLLGGAAMGGVFLPMHIPVLVAGLLLGPVSGCAVGVLAPLASSLITGMPSAVKLPFMLFELAAYGIVSGVMSHNRKIPIYVSLITAMIAGRAVNALCLLAVGAFMGFQDFQAFSVVTAAVTGIPGLILQLLLIPILVIGLRRILWGESRGRTAPIDLAIRELDEGGYTCVVRNGQRNYVSNHRGIAPLVHWLEETPCVLKNAVVADKVIGKAAALLLVHGGIKELYTRVISRPAVAVLRRAEISFSYGEMVEYIENRDKTGRCPMELRAEDIESPFEAFLVFSKIVNNNELKNIEKIKKSS